MVDLKLLNQYTEKYFSINYENGTIDWKSKLTKKGVLRKKPGWISNGYLYLSIKGKLTSAHRIIYSTYHQCTPDFIDHINRDKKDNRISNLRACTKQQNHFNTAPTCVNKSGYKGVSWRPNKCKWRARITINKKEISLGHFTCKREAARVYNLAARMYHGKFAYTNII